MNKRRMKNEALIAPFLVQPIAHRGLHDENKDENSLAAFRAAIEQRYAIELDVHLSKDGQLIVVHDSSLERVTGQSGVVEEMELNKIRLFTLRNSGEKLPLLSEVLETINGRVPLLIELKVSKNRVLLADATIACLARYKAKTMIAIQSFDPLVMKYLRKAYPKAYAYGQLASRDIGENQPRYVHFLFNTMLVNWISQPNFAAYDINYLPKCLIKRLRRKMPVLTWTVDNEKKLQLAKKVADNIIFERLNPAK
ncbi:glycerophosphodiester phosphodiesterase family protein [Trichlorobacter sp.]|uniref:glycerophosphodiester phosphodiesterase family protein n=1 Tax=Trichlorobacter sp. TaxID=2911007 RepID=UPI002A36EF1C|nr:glycerophosphodiester phosphodiesterase family protein [Trichlorobacter sp.]MDY0385484.1 glycerophosphodiester phosphodiesterase family protein [Trichlorobacter sp.]